MARDAAGSLSWAYFGLQLVLNFANGAVVLFLVPFRVDVVDAAHKVVDLSVISTASAAVSIVCLPLAGWLSDRTRSRWGRRVPWMTGGLVACGAVIVLFSLAGSVRTLLALAVLLTLAYSAVAAPLFAVLADRTPPERRGTVGAIGGLGMWMGILGGVLTATALSDRLVTCSVALAAVALAGVPIALRLRRDSRSLPRATAGPGVGRWRQLSPRRQPDFAWAFVARVAMYAGYSSVTAYMLYTLQDYLGLSRRQATELIPVTSLVAIASVLATVYPAGRVSDRLGRRKAPVVVASLVMAVSTVLPMLVPTVAAYLAAFVLTGMGFGVYLAVDQALMTQVLPSAVDAGKDLGILTVASAAGQMIAPLIGGAAISLLGYPAMFGAASLLALVAAAAVLPIRSVR